MAYTQKKLILSSINSEDEEYEVFFNDLDNLIIQTKDSIGSRDETFICLSDEDIDALKNYLLTRKLD